MAISSFARSLVRILLASLLFPRVGGAHLDKTTSTLKNEDSASRRLQGYGGEGVFTNEALYDAVRLWTSDNGLAVDTYCPIQDWNTSMITDTTALFYQLSAFNGNISEWEVSSITSMNSMFYGATAFNGDISKWDVSSVFRMSSMFREARAFNGDISGWDVSNVKGMESMFREATAFNGDISEWDVSSATSMESMLRGATAFNGSISEWDVSSVTSMAFMFAGATAFNSDISEWDVSSSTDTRQMFYGATAFEQTLCWDLMNELYSLSMFNGSSGGLDPKCGKYIATTGNIWGRLHRLPLQFTKRESPDLDAYDDNEIETIPLIIGPHMPPFLHTMPYRYDFRSFGWMG